jgi:acyl-CoA thioester hydrolase
MSTPGKLVSLRWSDLDPNFHLRHSVYYDLAAQHRVDLLQASGIDIRTMQEQHFGPILFREECVFKKEIRLNDKLYLSTKVLRARPDGSRWGLQTEFLSEEGKVLAILTVDGAWIDTKTRRLADPTPPLAMKLLETVPRSDAFEWV